MRLKKSVEKESAVQEVYLEFGQRLLDAIFCRLSWGKKVIRVR